MSSSQTKPSRPSKLDHYLKRILFSDFFFTSNFPLALDPAQLSTTVLVRFTSGPNNAPIRELRPLEIYTTVAKTYTIGKTLTVMRRHCPHLQSKRIDDGAMNENDGTPQPTAVAELNADTDMELLTLRVSDQSHRDTIRKLSMEAGAKGKGEKDDPRRLWNRFWKLLVSNEQRKREMRRMPRIEVRLSEKGVRRMKELIAMASTGKQERRGGKDETGLVEDRRESEESLKGGKAKDGVKTEAEAKAEAEAEVELKAEDTTDTKRDSEAGPGEDKKPASDKVKDAVDETRNEDQGTPAPKDGVQRVEEWKSTEQV